MLVIGANYHFLMNRYPDAGGTLTYTTKAFGYDHGFLSSWFLIPVYVAIAWANVTALVLIARYLLGGIFQFGFHYTVLGYDVYFVEILISMAANVFSEDLKKAEEAGMNAHIAKPIDVDQMMNTLTEILS